MNMHIGAKRPAFTRKKLLLIAVAAIMLVLAWARAGFPYPDAYFTHYTMGPDGVLHVDGMMPPDTYGDPGGMMPPPGVNPDLVVTQKAGKKTYTYVATNNHGVYSIKRNGTAWVTLTLNKNTGQYEVSDPNGTGNAVLKLGTPHANVRPDASTR